MLNDFSITSLVLFYCRGGIKNKKRDIFSVPCADDYYFYFQVTGEDTIAAYK